MYKYDVERQVATLGEMFPRVADFSFSCRKQVLNFSDSCTFCSFNFSFSCILYKREIPLTLRFGYVVWRV